MFPFNRKRFEQESENLLRDLISCNVFGSDIPSDSALMDRIIEIFNTAKDEDHFVQLFRDVEEITPGHKSALRFIYKEEVKSRKKRSRSGEYSTTRRNLDRLCGAVSLSAALVLIVAMYQDDVKGGFVEALVDAKADVNDLLRPELEKLAGREGVDMWNEKFWLDIPDFIADRFKADPNFPAEFKRAIEARNVARKQERRRREKTDANLDPIADKVREWVYQHVDSELDQRAKDISKLDNAEEIVKYFEDLARELSQ